MIITLKDGSTKEYAEAKSVIEIASDISEGLARVACAGEVDGEVADLRTVIDRDCELNILTFDSEGGKGAFRHTTSHIMAQAIKRLFPNVKLAIGPSIEDGFYYDIDSDEPITAEDLPKIEAEMKKIVKENLAITRFTKPRAEAIEFFKEKNEPYKVELIEDLPEDSEISFYQQGEFVDLCAGPHLMTTKPVKALSLPALQELTGEAARRTKCLPESTEPPIPKRQILKSTSPVWRKQKNVTTESLERAWPVYDERRGTGLPVLPSKGYGSEKYSA